nr:hypothetical protein [Tanacetum cinerariifolium]
RARAGLPDVHRAEVRAVGVGITYGVEHGQLALVVEPFQTRHFGVQAQVVAQGQNAFGLFQSQRRPCLEIQVVAIRHHGIQPVIAAAELHHNKAARLAAGRIAQHRSKAGFGPVEGVQKLGHQQQRAGQGGRLQEAAALHGIVLSWWCLVLS